MVSRPYIDRNMEGEKVLMQKFRKFMNSVIPDTQNARVLLAVSGGVDSMVMAWLFSKFSIAFAIAHCNFQLRGNESDLDMLLVEEYARQLSVPFYCKKFDTRRICKESKQSVQEAARNLRYAWLQDLADANTYHYIATAHHLDDSIETALINLTRGTGVRGLSGIPQVNGKIIRPLLSVSRSEIESCAQSQLVPFRTDESNLEDAYLRNSLRNQIIPALKVLRPGFSEILRDFLERMQATADALEKFVDGYKLKCLKQEKDGVSIAISELGGEKYSGLILFEILKDFGFSAEVCRQLHDSLSGQSGKMFYSSAYKAIKDRDKIFILPILTGEEAEPHVISNSSSQVTIGNLLFSFEMVHEEVPPSFDKGNLTAYFDADRLQFPLLLRKMQPGDSIVPLGMHGRKKLSNLLVDKKIPLHEKENTWVLMSGNNIVWVPGLQMGECGKIAKGTRRIFKASMQAYIGE